MQAARIPQPGRRVLLAGSIDEEHNRLLKLLGMYVNAGYDVSFIGMDRRGGRAKRFIMVGATGRYLTGGWGSSNWKLLLGYPIWVLKVFWYLLRHDVDLVHSFELDSGLPTAMAAMLRGFPYLYDVQDNYDLRHHWGFPLRQIIRLVDRWVVRHAAGVIMPDKNRIVGPFAGFEEKIIIVPNCPPDVPRPADLPPRDERVTVLAMGEMSARRGIDFLLDAVEGMPSARLLMAGHFIDPEFEKRALAMPQVEFRGWLHWEQAIKLGYEADAVFAFYDPKFAVNKLANAQKWFDAMMTGTPILSNSEINNAAWLKEEDIAYLCPYGDVGALREVIQQIVADREAARAKGRRARRLFEQEFNWETMQRRVLGLAARALQADHAELKERVRAHWEEEVSGTRYGMEYVHDRRRFFEAIEQARYEQDYMLRDFARFSDGKGKKVLEIGLGTGTDFMQWVRAGADVTGRDLTEASVRLVREQLALEEFEGDVERGDAEHLSFPDDSFDIFYSWGVLHHTPDPEKALAEAHRVLKPGGTFRIMLYHRRSIAVFLVWLVFGPLRGRFFLSPRKAVYDNIESPGLKAYTRKEARALVGQFFPEPITIRTYLGSGDLLTHRLSKKYQRPVWRFLARIFPGWFVKLFFGHRFGSVMTIEAKK